MQLRENISAELETTLFVMIVYGDIPPGHRINEVHLSDRLGVSRTPLREALIRLEGDGILMSRPRRGFFVKELTEEEVAHLYEALAVLAPRALELAGTPSTERLETLEALIDEIEEPDQEAERLIRLDARWHLGLLGGCPNPILIDTIRGLIRRTHRYAHAYFREHWTFHLASPERRATLAALRASDVRRGCTALRQSFESAGRPLHEWLRGEGERT
jgi:DNA-binding GntR family transcriptional regulator